MRVAGLSACGRWSSTPIATRPGLAAAPYSSRIRDEWASSRWPTRGALTGLAEFHREGRLGDNLPRLVAVKAKDMPTDVRSGNRQDDRRVENRAVRHPSLRQRSHHQHQTRERRRGCFITGGRPRCCSRTSTTFARKSTWDFYRGVIRPNFQAAGMHPIDDLLGAQGRDTESQKALEQILSGHVQRAAHLASAGGDSRAGG